MKHFYAPSSPSPIEAGEHSRTGFSALHGKGNINRLNNLPDATD